MSKPEPSRSAIERANQLTRERGAARLVSREWTARFIDHYRQLDPPLIDADCQGLPLRRDCVCSDECWPAEMLAADQRKADDVTLPWVGTDYEQHRVLVVADNVRGGGGLGDELGIVDEVQREMEQGRDRVPDHSNSTFGPGCAVYADAVLRWLESRVAPTEPKDPRELAAERVYARFARLQTVKCSPFNTLVNKPTDTMGHNCPKTYLFSDLELLRPRVIVAMGHAAIGRLRMATGLEVPDFGQSRRCEAPWARELLVAATYHPARGLYRPGFDLLVEALRGEDASFSGDR